jgi:hypothetical protein
LLIVGPEIVVRWHRERFRQYWPTCGFGRSPARRPFAVVRGLVSIRGGSKPGRVVR